MTLFFVPLNRERCEVDSLRSLEGRRVDSNEVSFNDLPASDEEASDKKGKGSITCSTASTLNG